MIKNRLLYIRLLITIGSFVFIHGKHFNGGTITWTPVNPYDNDSSIDITITQSYSWTYPYVKCANNVPISTSTFSGANTNLICVTDCSTDGGYSSTPINILTNCTSASTAMKMMTSEATKKVTLAADAHFYLAYKGTAWATLNDPPEKGLEWSIVTYIDLRKRPDGLINTPPVAIVSSPQYAIVNRTMQINIPVSDVNLGDDIRCRWSTYTTGYRRRKRESKEVNTINEYTYGNYKGLIPIEKDMHARSKRFFLPDPCASGCGVGCLCSKSVCTGTDCNGILCSTAGGCKTTTPSTSIATTIAATTTTTILTTTIETLGTLISTSSFPIRQAIDECAGICYPDSLPSGTTLSNCTISFRGYKAGIWYAVAIQVEDFIDGSSSIPMSSVPVQLLIYVMPEPTCSTKPIILPLSRCLEVQVGVSLSFDIYAMNLCPTNVAILASMVVASGISGMTNGNLTSSSTNSSLSYVTFTWIPQVNQIGQQKLCTIVYTDEQVQSDQYCITFTVKTSSELCVTTTTSTTTTSTSTRTTTTTSTSTTSITTTTTSATTTTTTSSTSTTTTTTSTSTSTTTTSTSSTSSTSTTASTSTSTTSTSTTSTTTSTTTTSTSTSTTSSTSTTTTTTSTTSTTTSTTTTSTSTSTTTTSSTTSTSSSTSTSSTTSTSTSTSTTSVTTTTTTSTTTTTATTKTTTTAKAAEHTINWLLILGISLSTLLLALCCFCYCLYRFCWGYGARRNRRKHRQVDTTLDSIMPKEKYDLTNKIWDSNRNLTAKSLKKKTSTHYRLQTNNRINSGPLSKSYTTLSFAISSATTNISTDEAKTEKNSLVSVKKINHTDLSRTNDVIKDFSEDEDKKEENVNMHNSKVKFVRVNKVSKLNQKDEKKSKDSTITEATLVSPSSMSQLTTNRINVHRVSRQRTTGIQPSASSSANHTTVIRLSKSAIDLQSKRIDRTDHSASTNTTRNTKSGVTVTKISKKIMNI